MENLLLIQISDTEIRQLFREELETFFAKNRIGQPQAETDEIGGIALAMTLTGLAKATIYSLVSLRQIPHSKRGKRLYFSRRELIEWITNGKRKTQAEITLEAAGFGQKNMEAIQSTKTRNRFQS